MTTKTKVLIHDRGAFNTYFKAKLAPDDYQQGIADALWNTQCGVRQALFHVTKSRDGLNTVITFDDDDQAKEFARSLEKMA